MHRDLKPENIVYDSAARVTKKPLPPPKRILAPSKWPKSFALDELELEPKINWADGLRAATRHVAGDATVTHDAPALQWDAGYGVVERLGPRPGKTPSNKALIKR